MAARPPVLALTQGDPAGIGPEILLKLVAGLPPGDGRYVPLLVAERAALEAVRGVVPGGTWERLAFLDAPPGPGGLQALPAGAVAVLDPVGRPRPVAPGRSGPDDARGALAALDLGIELSTTNTFLVGAPRTGKTL